MLLQAARGVGGLPLVPRVARLPQQQAVASAQALQVPQVDLKTVFFGEDAEHLLLGRVPLPQLLDPRDNLLILVRGAVLGREVPFPELGLEGAPTAS